MSKVFLPSICYIVGLGHQPSLFTDNHTIMAGVLRVSLLVCFWIATCNLLVSAGKIKTNSINLCMMNCGQCKEMYGDYFDGPRCAEFCFSSKGAGEPDCNKPDTVGKFLKIMEKFRLNQAKNQRHREQDTIYPNSYDPDNNNNVWKRQYQEQNQLKLSRWFFV